MLYTPLSRGSTVTSNVIVNVFPADNVYASTLICLPLIVASTSVLSFSFALNESVTYVNPAGIVSVTLTTSESVPLFSTVIVYLILSFSCSIFPVVWFTEHSTIALDLLDSIFGFTTLYFPLLSSVGFPFTVDTLVAIVLLYTPAGNVFTFAVNSITSVFPAARL